MCAGVCGAMVVVVVVMVAVVVAVGAILVFVRCWASVLQAKLNEEFPLDVQMATMI
jgi:hypothetical protein